MRVPKVKQKTSVLIVTLLMLISVYYTHRGHATEDDFTDEVSTEEQMQADVSRETLEEIGSKAAKKKVQFRDGDYLDDEWQERVINAAKYIQRHKEQHYDNNSNFKGVKSDPVNKFDFGTEKESQPVISWCPGREPAFRPLNVSNASKVGLISNPGSGNTWVRHLLQQSTGILTGSVYSDGELRRNGFSGESVRDERVLAVKCHEFHEDWFDKIILIVRHPKHSIVSEFNRAAGRGNKRHTAKVTYDKFFSAKWPKFVADQAKRWEYVNREYLTSEKFSPPNRSLIVFYDDLVEDAERELRRMLGFLDVDPINEEWLKCAVKDKGLFKRTNSYYDDVFTRKMSDSLEMKWTQIINTITIRT